MRIERHLSFLLMAVAAAAIIVGVFARGGDSGTSSAASAGAATFTLTGGLNLNNTGTVDVPLNLSSFTPGTSANWGGYDLEVAYDATIVKATADVIGPSNPCGAFWANTTLGGTVAQAHLVSGCSFQASTFTGILETITFTCQGVNGTSNITMIPLGDPLQTDSGTKLFDQNAVPFDMTLQNTTVTCGSGPVPTATDTPIPPTATNTPVPPTATNTPAPTNTVGASTQTAQAGATQTAQANFGSAITATPTFTPVPPTATTAAGSPSAGSPTSPSGGATATKPSGGQGAGVILPNTGTGGGGNGLGNDASLALILGGALLATAGAGLFVKSRRAR